MKPFALLAVLATLGATGCASLGASMLDSYRADLTKTAGLAPKTVRAGAHEVAVLEGGRGPTVLLLHGATGQKEDWLEVAATLTADHRVVLVDLPPYGATAPVAGVRYDLPTSAQALADILDALALDDVHLVGSSMGGHVVAEYARTHADRVASVTLVGAPGVRAPKQTAFFAALERGEMPFAAKNRDDVALFTTTYLWVKPPDAPGFIMDAVYDRRVARNAIDVAAVQAYLPHRYDLEAHLAAITVPAFALWGAEDRQIDVSAVEVLRKGLPDLRDVVILEECGHLPHVEQPAKAAAALRRFFANTAPRAAAPAPIEAAPPSAP